LYLKIKMVNRFSRNVLCIAVFYVMHVQAQPPQMSPEDVDNWYQGMSTYFNSGPVSAEAMQAFRDTAHQVGDAQSADSSSVTFSAPSSMEKVALAPHIAAVVPAGGPVVPARAAIIEAPVQAANVPIVEPANAQAVNAVPVQAAIDPTVHAKVASAEPVQASVGRANAPAQAANVPTIERTQVAHVAAIEPAGGPIVLSKAAKVEPANAPSQDAIPETNIKPSNALASNVKSAVVPVVQPNAAVAPITPAVEPVSVAAAAAAAAIEPASKNSPVADSHIPVAAAVPAAAAITNVQSVPAASPVVTKAVIQDTPAVAAAPIVPVTTIHVYSSTAVPSPPPTAIISAAPTTATTSAMVTTRTTTSQTTSSSMTRSVTPSATTTIPPISAATRSGASSIFSLFVALVVMVFVYL
jgi:hypothetical protein